jgi:hypothetical protein
MRRATTQARPANWLPVFVSLVRADQKLHAVKLLALAFRYTTREGRPDFARAIKHFDAITSLNTPVPSGTEHPDIDETVLAHYRAKVMRQRT